MLARVPGEQPIMRVRAEREGAVVVLHLEGRLTIEEDGHLLPERVRSMTDGEPRDVVLDFGRVRQLDCSGIGQLVELYHQVRDAGGLFSLVNVEHRQKRLLAMLGLLRVFPVFATREEALTACWSATVRGGAPRPPWRGASAAAAFEGTLQQAV